MIPITLWQGIIIGIGFLPFAEATALIFIATLGVIFFSRALYFGNAGPIQAIDNSKVIVQSTLAAVFLGQVPDLIQICGLVSGLLGVAVIVLKKEK